MKYFPVLLANVIISASGFAQLDAYSYKRKLQKTEQPGFCSVQLIPELTAKMKSKLNDVRLFNIDQNDTTELPYIFEWLGNKTESSAVPFERINDTYNQKCCSYVTLKLNEKQVISQIRLDVEDAEFDKRVTVEGSNDNKQWFTIKEHIRIVRFMNGSENYSYTSLDFKSTEYSYYRIKFDDDGSKKITITNAYAFLKNEIPGAYSPLESRMGGQAENKEQKTSEIIVDLPHRYLLNHMIIQAESADDFYRNMNVYATAGTYPTAKGEKENWYIIHSSVLSSAENQPVHFNNQASTKIKIEILNHDNQPVKIKGIKLFAEQCRLVTKLPEGGNNYITYGRENDRPPAYDLVHFKDKIPAELKNISYEGEEITVRAAGLQNPLMSSKMWLWTIIGLVILVIGYFALNMIRKEQQHKGE